MSKKATAMDYKECDCYRFFLESESMNDQESVDLKVSNGYRCKTKWQLKI